MINLLWPYARPKYAVLLSITCTTLDASGNTFQWMQLRILSTLLLVAEQTTVIVYYMVYLSAILTRRGEFKTQPPDLSLCRTNFAILPQCSISTAALAVSFRNNFKILLLTFKAIHELAPSYINELVKTQDIDCDLSTEYCCLTRILKL